ncbi:hypothetical protein ACFQ07_02570, partial [Actinomadura adrarensis]
VDKAARRTGAEAVIIAGDPRARTTVMEEVSPDILECAVESDRGDALEIDLSRVLDLKTAERVFTVAERFERELAHGERAVAGLPATVEAVRKGQVETLILDEDPDNPSRLWIGPDPVDVATKPDELNGKAHEDRADAALIRAVAATDGDLVILPSNGPEVTLGVGAVLRYSDPTTVHY